MQLFPSVHKIDAGSGVRARVFAHGERTLIEIRNSASIDSAVRRVTPADEKRFPGAFAAFRGEDVEPADDEPADDDPGEAQDQDDR